MSSRRKRLRKCIKKTKRGNVFSDETSAWASAKQMTKKFGKPICAYKCQNCKNWHIGTWNNNFSKEALNILYGNI